MIPPEVRAEIRRLFWAEHFTVNAIATCLGVHHDAVERALGVEQFSQYSAVRKSQLDPYLPLMRATLEEHPRIRASRLFLMIRDRGYKGSARQVRRLVRRLRPSGAKAYLAVNVLPGEHAQVDWASFGTLRVGRALRKLSCFVMVLSYSRWIYADFTLDQTLESFLRCHVAAFREAGGVPRVLRHDNLKSAVLERVGTAIRFHPAYLELAGHYHFRPEPCTPAAGWQKGRVERAILYLRTSYEAARTYRDLDDARRQLRRWLNDVANVRPWPQDRTRTVADALAEEKPYLLPLPANDLDTAHVESIRSGKQPYVRFDLNDYTIPHRLVRQPLTLVAVEHTVRVLDGTEEVARHVRSYDRDEKVEDPAHLAGLLEQRPRAAVPKAQDRLASAVPETIDLLHRLALRGENLGSNVARLLDLLHDYGADELRVAAREALDRDTPRATSVASILLRRRCARTAPPVLPIRLPDDPRVRDLQVVSHDPATYDSLTRNSTENSRDD